MATAWVPEAHWQLTTSGLGIWMGSRQHVITGKHLPKQVRVDLPCLPWSLGECCMNWKCVRSQFNMATRPTQSTLCGTSILRRQTWLQCCHLGPGHSAHCFSYVGEPGQRFKGIIGVRIESHRRSLEVKLSTISTDGKAEVERVKEEKKRNVRRSGKRKREKKEDAGARKGRKVAIDCVFPMICDSGGSKSRLAKAAGAEPAGQMRDEKLHAVVARSTLVSKKAKTPHVRTTFGSWDVEKVHAVVVRSIFRSQKCQKLTVSDHFWKLRCRKNARRCGAMHLSKSKCTTHTNVGALLEVTMPKKCTLCGAKHISKSKCTKHTNVGALLEVAMPKKCTLLWREAHFQLKNVKNWGVRTTFGRSDVVSHGRRKGVCTLSKVSTMWTWGFCSSVNYNYNYNYNHNYTLHSTTLHSITLQLHYATLHYTLHSIALRYTTPTTTTTLLYSTLH